MINNRPYATPPIYVPIHPSQPSAIHSSWLNYFESLTQQLNQTLTPTGNVMPAVSDGNATSVEGVSPQKIIFNTTTSAYQGNIDGAWETFTTVTSLEASAIPSFVGTHPDRVQFVYDTDNDELYVVKGSTQFKLVKI